jgi:hypothetical protein
MTRQLNTILALSSLLLCAPAIVHSAPGQAPQQPAVSSSKNPPIAMPVSDQMTNIPYFTLRDGMSSTLTLNNLAPTATKVTVTIFNTKGQAHVLDPMTLDPHSFTEVKLEDVVPREDFDSGNVEVAFNGIPMVVTCQVSIFSVKHRVSFESREQDMMDFESVNLAGILSLPKGGDGFLAVTNVSSNKLTFQLTAGSLKKTVALFPRETELIKLNDNDDERTSETTLVKLQHNGLPGDVITTGYVLNLKDGYSSGFAMLDPGIMRSSKLAGAHFRAGQPDPSEGFPKDTRFRSPLLLANVSAGPVVAHVSVDYTVKDNQDSRDESDDAKKNSTKTPKDTVVKVKDVTIAPGDVQRVELSDALGGVGQIAEAGVDIAYDAPPGSVIGHLTSVDQSGDYAFEVPVKDPEAMSETMESIYPWTLESGTATVLHLKNTTDQTVEADVLIRFAGGTYQPDKVELQPYQTIALDIQKLKDSKKPDVLGHVFPSGATRGQLVWFQKTPYTLIGRAEGTDVAAGIARSFSCGTRDCCTYYDSLYYLTPGSMSGPPGDAGTFSATNILRDCYNSTFTYYNVQPPSWTSTNYSVATVSSSGYTYCAGPGTATIFANFTKYNYYWNSAGTRCLSSTVGAPASAPVNVNCGDQRDTVVQEYVTYAADFIPSCTDFSQYTHSAYFQASELRNGDDYSWALVRVPLTVDQSSGYGLDKWRANYGSSRIINSGYRNPAHNFSVGGVFDSQHLHGTAADLRNQMGTTLEYNNMVTAAQNAGSDFIEPTSGPCSTACVHSDWRNHNMGQYVHD